MTPSSWPSIRIAAGLIVNGKGPVVLCRRHMILSAAGFVLAGFAPQVAFAAPEPYMIFFDRQSAELFPFAKAILIVIQPLMKANTRTSIVGHADMSESEPDMLSLARANAVVTALVNMTMPSSATLVPSGKGTSELRTPTGPFVAEATNRYVSITIE